jgi:hypothetical protein
MTWITWTLFSILAILGIYGWVAAYRYYKSLEIHSANLILIMYYLHTEKYTQQELLRELEKVSGISMQNVVQLKSRLDNVFKN